MNRESQVELFILLTLIDFKKPASWHKILNYIRQKGYMQPLPDKYAFRHLLPDLRDAGMVRFQGKDKKAFITKDGMKRLRNLSAQAGTGRVTSKGQQRIDRFRAEHAIPLPNPSLASSKSSTRVRQRKVRRQLVLHRKIIFPSANNPRLLKAQELEKKGSIYPYDILANAALTNTGHYYVYVIFLREEAKQKYPKFHGLDPNLPPVYVGQSYNKPEDRLKIHLTGEKHYSRHARNFGIRLIPELYQDYNPLSSRDQSLRVEDALAEKLRRLGYSVFGGH